MSINTYVKITNINENEIKEFRNPKLGIIKYYINSREIVYVFLSDILKLLEPYKEKLDFLFNNKTLSKEIRNNYINARIISENKSYKIKLITYAVALMLLSYADNISSENFGKRFVTYFLNDVFNICTSQIKNCISVII